MWPDVGDKLSSGMSRVVPECYVQVNGITNAHNASVKPENPLALILVLTLWIIYLVDTHSFYGFCHLRFLEGTLTICRDATVSESQDLSPGATALANRWVRNYSFMIYDYDSVKVSNVMTWNGLIIKFINFVTFWGLWKLKLSLLLLGYVCVFVCVWMYESPLQLQLCYSVLLNVKNEIFS